MTRSMPTPLAAPHEPSPELDIPRHFSLVSIATAITTVGIMVLMKVTGAAVARLDHPRASASRSASTC